MRRFAAFLLWLVGSTTARAEPDVDALVLQVRFRDATPAARGAPPDTTQGRAALAELLERSWIDERWTLAGASAAIELLGKYHPLPDLGRVLIAESGDRADFLRTGAAPLSLPPRLLGDLFEGALTRRSGYTVVHEAAPEFAVGDGTPWRLVLRQQSRTGGWHRMVTTRITVWYRQARPEEAALARLAVDLIGLPHLGPEGRVLLRREGAAVGIPLRWSVAVEDESLAGRNAMPVLEGEVIDVARRSVPASTVRTSGPPRYEPIVHDAGGQLGDPALFGRLRRSGEREGPLAVANRTPFCIFVLVDGVLGARVGPHSQIDIHGLAPGYYRLYARTRLGTLAWGPRDAYVPGAMTVAMP